ncbi:Amidase [Niveomyces insectorum RCEF 264]|uniref:amidase n=1 Tax=Niveomyces insectorum RCEF 264 TaxID=1081102 RepID=A0A167MM96_9HYPO|nr:Amidase [Niveomyces insectorum RCEF 264]
MTSSPSAHASWQNIGQAKRDAIQSHLPDEWKITPVPPPAAVRDAGIYARQFLSPEEIEITEALSARVLLSRLARGELSAVQVTKAFCHRATIAHQLTNCLSEVIFTQALADAKALDVAFQRNGRRTVGPLHGLPISLKDQYRVRDTETSLGYVGWLGRKETPETESWIVQELRRQGAVVFAKTNVPTSLMAIETNNNLIGYTLNAANRLLSSGGSSGGEAALIASGGSLLGLGSDVGASIRLPSGYNGIVGLRPSHGRLPYLGVANSMVGHNTLESVVGPLGRSIEDLRLLVKTVLAAEPWKADPKVLKLPWRDDEELDALRKIVARKLTFGVLRDDGVVSPQPPVQRVLQDAVTKLKTRGYEEVIEWDPPAHSEAFDIAFKAFTADAGHDIHTQLALSGEPPVPEIAAVYGATAPPPDGRPSVNDLWTLQRRRDAFQELYVQYWETTPVDALLVPVAPAVGYERGKGLYPGYTAAFSVLDYSVVTVRAGKAEKTRDKVRERFGPRGEFDREIQAQYDPELFDGSPVGLQVVCRRLEEEKVLAIAEEVEKIIYNAENKSF